MDFTHILIAVLGVLWVITCTLAGLVWKNLQTQIAGLKGQIDCKVDKAVYDLVQSSLIQDMRELKAGMESMARTLDDIRIALATTEGIKIERERKRRDD